MAKALRREYVWLECRECGDRNYRTEVNVQGGAEAGIEEVLQAGAEADGPQDTAEIIGQASSSIGRAAVQNRRLGVRIPPGLL